MEIEPGLGTSSEPNKSKHRLPLICSQVTEVGSEHFCQTSIYLFIFWWSAAQLPPAALFSGICSIMAAVAIMPNESCFKYKHICQHAK